MIRVSVVCALATFVAAPLLGPLSAQQDLQSVSLEEALRLFAEDNLDLRLARARTTQTTALARQARAFPNPSFNASHEPLSGGGRSYSETYVTASQRVELSGSRGARSDAGAMRGRAAEYELLSDSISLAFEVKRAYVQALRAQERRAVMDRIVMVFRDAEQRATERFDAGDVSRYTLRRIRAEHGRYETLLADADIEVGSAQRSLALLVAPESSSHRLEAEPLSPRTPPEVPSGAVALAAVERRPELEAARADVEAEAAQARLMRAERIPDLTATAGFKRQSDDLSGAFLGVSMPVPLFDRGGGSVAASEAGLRGAEERLALTRRLLENDVLGAIDSYEALQRRAQLLESETDAGADLLEMALVAYEEGEMELLELLDAADALQEAQTAEASLRAALWIAYFDLERAAGGFTAPPAQGDAP